MKVLYGEVWGIHTYKVLSGVECQGDKALERNPQYFCGDELLVLKWRVSSSGWEMEGSMIIKGSVDSYHIFLKKGTALAPTAVTLTTPRNTSLLDNELVPHSLSRLSFMISVTQPSKTLWVSSKLQLQLVLGLGLKARRKALVSIALLLSCLIHHCTSRNTQNLLWANKHYDGLYRWGLGMEISQGERLW